MTDDTIFRIYSMTKPVVCVALMTLLEEGRIRLTDPVAAYLPAFGAVQVLAEDGSVAELVRPMKVRDLLTHTSGLTNELQPTPVAGLYREAEIHHDATGSLETMIGVVASMPLAFQPGTRWQYSVGIDVVARLIEVLDWKPLSESLLARVFAPLGMHDTAFALRLRRSIGLPRCTGFRMSLPAACPGEPLVRQSRPVFTSGSTCPTRTRSIPWEVLGGEASGCTRRPATTCDSRRCS